LSGFMRYLKGSDYRGTKYVNDPDEEYGNN
jgi:hypothetical protein